MPFIVLTVNEYDHIGSVLFQDEYTIDGEEFHPGYVVRADREALNVLIELIGYDKRIFN